MIHSNQGKELFESLSVKEELNENKTEYQQNSNDLRNHIFLYSAKTSE